MSEKDDPTDEKKFNEALKRMLKTPPEPHAGKKKQKDSDKSKDDKPAN